MGDAVPPYGSWELGVGVSSSGVGRKVPSCLDALDLEETSRTSVAGRGDRVARLDQHIYSAGGSLGVGIC